MVPSIVHTLISILPRFGSQFYKYNLLYCKRVGRQSIRHPLNSDIRVCSDSEIKVLKTKYIDHENNNQEWAMGHGSRQSAAFINMNRVKDKGNKFSKIVPYCYCGNACYFLWTLQNSHIKLLISQEMNIEVIINHPIFNIDKEKSMIWKKYDKKSVTTLNNWVTWFYKDTPQIYP